MATVEKTVSILFYGDDQLSKKVRDIQKTIGSFTGSVESLAAPLAGVADGILKTDAALMALAMGGLAYAFAKSSEFETAVVELEKVLGDQPEALEAAKKAAFDLSRQYGESSSAILLSTADFKQAGFDIVDSITLTKNAMDLSIAGSIESSEASEILIATLKGFKEPATEAARLVDILNEVSNKYATSAHELGIGMAKLSPIANLMGFSFEETAGILTPVIEIFRSGDEAAVALRTGLLRLISDRKPVTDALESIGVAQHNANGSLRSGKDILLDVATAFKTAEEDNKLFLAAQLVGIPQSARMVEVFNGLATSMEVTGVAMNAAGSAALEVAARLESSEVIVNRFKEGFKNLAIVVGDQFQEAAKEAIDGGTAIENALEDIIKDGTFAPVFDALSDFGSEIGKYLEGIAEAMPEAFERIDFDGLLDALDSIGGSLGELFDGLDLTDPEDLAEAIQFIVDSLESLALVTKGMVDVFGPLTKNIIESIKGFNDMDDATKETSGNILAVAKAITDIGVVTAGLLVTLGQNAKAIKKAFSLVINSIESMWDSTVITVEGILLFVAEIVQSFFELLNKLPFTDWAEKAADSIQMFQDSLKEDIASRAQDNLDKLSKAFGSADEAIKETTKNVEDFANTDAEIELQVEADREALQAHMDEVLGFVDGVKPKVKIDAETEEVEQKVVELNEIIEEELPSEKWLEIKLKGEIDIEIARIKATAGTVQTAMEWTAKLNIAGAEADAKRFKAVFVGMSSTIESTGDLLGDLWGLWAKAGTVDQWDLEDQIRAENKTRKEAHELQMNLGKAELELAKARKAAMEAGEGLITITADGLEPELEGFMWKILEKIQIRASEEGAEFLLGI